MNLPAADALYEHAACGLLLTTTDGAIRRANATFCRWIGAEAAELCAGRRFQDLLTVGARIFHFTHVAPLLQMQGSVSELKLDLLHRDGSALPILLNAVRREHAGQHFDELAVSVARDRHAYERELLAARTRAEDLLREEQHMQRALADAEARLREALDDAQDRALFAEQLVGIVSHDLRTPLHAIRLAAHVLERLDDKVLAARPLGTIVRSTQRAQRLVDDLLDFTAARLGGGIAVARAPVELHRLVADALDELRAAWPDRQLVHDAAGEGRCEADAHRLAQLIGNLVANAAVYGDPTRPITVSSRLGEHGCSIAVHNHGAPIPEALLPTLFDPMVRGGARPVGRSVGLGLAIVREIARAHGGRVTVVSSADKGTLFTFSTQPVDADSTS